MLQGFANGFIGACCFSIVTIEFPWNREKYVGIVETAIGLALIAGPLLGATLNFTLGFFMTFIVVGLCLLLGLFLVYTKLPNRLNRSVDIGPTKIIAEARTSVLSHGAIREEVPKDSDDSESDDEKKGGQ